MADLSRFSLNQVTTNRLDLRQAVEACVRHRIPAIGVWRDKLQQTGIEEAKNLLATSGLSVSSLCRGGFFPAATSKERKHRIFDNLAAIDEAAGIGAEVLVLVCGGLKGCSIANARKMIADGIAEIVQHAKAAGIKLGIEPLHPMFAADRSIVCSLREANDLAERFDRTVGVIVDVFHIWHEADVYMQIARAGSRIYGFHVSDWKVPLPDVLLSRSMMGDGVIELSSLCKAVTSAGYKGPIEVEIFNQEIWETDSDQVLRFAAERFRSI